MWCSAFSFAVPLVAEPIPCLNFQKLSKSRDGLQKSDLKSTYQLFSRSGFHLNPKEFSPWTSLMARDLPLGPSVAPWPVETSTAHGNSSFWAMVFLSGIVKSLWLTLSALDNALSWVSSLMLPPETRYSPQPSLPSPVSRRRMHFSLRSTKTKLGFLLEGLKLIVGPLTLLRPKPICYNPNLQSIKIRSVLTLLLSLSSQRLDRFYEFIGMGHQLRHKSLSLLRIYFHHLRTLTLVATMALSIVSKSMKTYRLLFLNRSCRRFVCGHGGPCFNFYTATMLSNVSTYRSSTIIFKTRILCSQDKFVLLMSDPEPLLYVVKQVPSDYKSIVARTCSDLLLRVALVKPTRRSAMVPSSTSHSLLLTVTNLSSIDSLVEDPSTNRDLTWAKSSSSICLKALMDPLSICSIYPIVALGNVVFYALNFGSFDPSSLYLVLS